MSEVKQHVSKQIAVFIYLETNGASMVVFLK